MFQKNQIILLLLFTFIYFFHIKENEYTKMIGYGFALLIVSHLLRQSSNIYERFDDSKQFTEEEEINRRQEPQYDDSTVQNEEAEEEAEEDIPMPANTPFVSAEYAQLRDEAREEESPVVTDKNDTPDGNGPIDPEPISSDKTFEEGESPKLKVVESKFRMGPYDGLCISSDSFSNEEYIQNSDLVTIQGVQGPIEVSSSQDVLKGPTIDGTKDAPQKLSLFANNKTNFKCCGESPFTTSTGCICLTENQRNFIRSRGLNKTYADL